MTTIRQDIPIRDYGIEIQLKPLQSIDLSVVCDETEIANKTIEYASFLSTPPLLSMSTVLNIFFNFALKRGLPVKEFSFDCANLRNFPFTFLEAPPSNLSASAHLLSSSLNRLSNADGSN